jgi:hypothetical protein
MSSGSARAVSIISPKAFFASRADMDFMGRFRGGPRLALWAEWLFSQSLTGPRDGVRWRVIFGAGCGISGRQD